MKKKVKDLLSSNDIKFTVAREAILKVLSSAKSPLSYEDIKHILKIDMDKATFYRNISLFENKKIVQKFESNDKKWYFELTKKSHAHFVCESCHNITCIDIKINKNLKEHKVNNILLSGICKDCK